MRALLSPSVALLCVLSTKMAFQLKARSIAGDGEVDIALLDLLQQNIDAATAAGQAQAAEFMTKVRVAAMKFVITT